MEHLSPPPEGTVAIVRTPAYRCLGMLREDGQWVDAYHPEYVITDVLEYTLPGGHSHENPAD